MEQILTLNACFIGRGTKLLQGSLKMYSQKHLTRMFENERRV
jgi:hypothetical protein